MSETPTGSVIGGAAEAWIRDLAELPRELPSAPMVGQMAWQGSSIATWTGKRWVLFDMSPQAAERAANKEQGT